MPPKMSDASRSGVKKTRRVCLDDTKRNQPMIPLISGWTNRVGTNPSMGDRRALSARALSFGFCRAH